MATAEQFKTLYEWLGVSTNAGDREVQEAWHHHETEAHFQLDKIPPVVTLAYKILHDSNGRTWYREVLDACKNGHPIVVPPDKRNAFETVCRLTEVRFWPDDKLPDAFLVRLPGQPEPKSVRQRSAGEPTKRKATTQRWLGYVFRQVFLFQSFRNKTFWEKLGLLILYGAACSGAFIGITNANDAIKETIQRRLNDAVHTGHAQAAEKLRKVEQGRGDFHREFQAVTGVPLDKSARSIEQRSEALDLAILRYDTVREAWSEIERTDIRVEEFAPIQASLDAIHRRAQSNQAVKDDKSRLKEIDAWLERKAKAIQLQRQYLDHIGVMLNVVRSEQSTDNPDNNTERSGS